jgi:hypothetical protein
MKTIKLIFLLITLLFLCSSCKVNTETKDNVPSKAERKEDDQNQNSTTRAVKTDKNEKMKEEIIQSITRVNQWNENKIIKNEYTMNQESCKTEGLVAPAYVDEKRIIFLSYGRDVDRIYEFSTVTNECEVIYQSKGISNITGNEGKIFWPEYDTKKVSNVDWKIKSLDLLDRKVSEVASGGSYKDTPTPTIKYGVGTINWIEYEIQGEDVISKLIQYDIKTNIKNTISESTLNESNKREGEYYILQQGTDSKEKNLLYKTIFKDGEKSFDISLQNGKQAKSLLTQNNVLDFITDDNFFVYTGEGHLTSLHIDEPKKKSIFKTGNRLTTDTPIFIKTNTLVFRYAMNEILILNLDKNISYSLTDYSDLVSKPVYTNGLLTYGIKSSTDGNEKVTFNVVKID